jgi:hypothetical protein
VVTRLELVGLQRNPLAKEPETPAVSVAGGQRVHLLTHPVEGLVVTTSLIDAAAMPVDGARTTVVSMIATCWLAWPITSPRICACRSKTDTE